MRTDRRLRSLFQCVSDRRAKFFYGGNDRAIALRVQGEHHSLNRAAQEPRFVNEAQCLVTGTGLADFRLKRPDRCPVRILWV